MVTTNGVIEGIVSDVGYPEYEGVAYSSWYQPIV
jgi:hypothetical protein